MTYHLDLADIQGYILRGYNMPCVRHFVLSITDALQGRAFLGRLVDQGEAPQITAATKWQSSKPPYCLNIGLTFSGLQALALPRTTLSSFPPAFVAGAVNRAARLGDSGTNAPEHWDAALRTHRTHLLLSLYANGATRPAWEDELARRTEALRSLFRQYAIEEMARPYDGEVLKGETDTYEHVHFGFRDGIAQPLIAGVTEIQGRSAAASPGATGSTEKPVPPGAFLFGYPSQWNDFSYPVPEPAMVGVNGSFAAFRVMEQDVQSFQEYILHTAERFGMLQPLGHVVADIAGELTRHLDNRIFLKALRLQFASEPRSRLSSQATIAVLEKGREWRVYDQGKTYVIKKDGRQLRLYTPEQVAAKICGRWFNGYPLAVPDFRDFHAPALRQPGLSREELNRFDYLQDEDGHGCPFGAHIRRNNPRTDRIAGNTSEDIAERGSVAQKRRIIRRGMPYGPEFTGSADGQKRGLLGLFICLSLEDQFEFVMSQWVNGGGFHGPLPTDTKDPLIGHPSVGNVLSIPGQGRHERLRDFPQFVTTRGSLYCFLPGITALRYIAALPR